MLNPVNSEIPLSVAQFADNFLAVVQLTPPSLCSPSLYGWVSPCGRGQNTLPSPICVCLNPTVI